MSVFLFCFFFCKQKTAYEMRISDWSSDVCSSDLERRRPDYTAEPIHVGSLELLPRIAIGAGYDDNLYAQPDGEIGDAYVRIRPRVSLVRSEEHTSELQSLMRISYAVFCLKKKKKTITKWNR